MSSKLKLPQVTTGLNRGKKTFNQAKARFGHFLSSKPFASFFGLLGILLVIIIIGNFLRKPPANTAKPEVQPKLVNVYQSGQSPTMTLTGKVEESGIITIVAQTSGVVQKINVAEGKHVNRSNTLMNLSANYNGSTPAVVSRQVEQLKTQFSNDTYETQKDIINRNRDLANKGDTNAAELRDIDRQSLDDTRRLIDLNTSIVDSLNTNLNNIQANSSSTPADILSAKQAVSQATGTLNQLTAGLTKTEYTSSDTTTPAQTADANRDLTLRKLDIDEKNLDLNKNLANLSLKLAKINESAYFPVSPCAGIVERVFVKVGQNVSPGTPIATIKADARQLDIVVPVSIDLAKQVVTTEPSTITVNGHKLSLTPRFVSTTPTEGALAAIFYTVPTEEAQPLDGQSNVVIQVPIGFAETTNNQVYVPLDAVYQTQEKSFVYAVNADDKGKLAHTKEVVLGDVSGQYVQVLSGLNTNDQIITDRGITDGDRIRTE